MNTYLINALEDEYRALHLEFGKLHTEVKTIQRLLAGVEYTAGQENSMLNVANRKVDRIHVLDEELFVIENLLEIYRADENMEPGGTIH